MREEGSPKTLQNCLMKLQNNNTMQNIKFYPSLADAKDFPAPQVTMLPELSLSHIFSAHSAENKTLFGNCEHFFYEGRYALFQALLNIDLEPGCIVLVPAYHCRSMIEPVIYLQLKVVLYPVDKCLNPDFEFIERFASNNKVNVIILPHYFGFPQDMEKVLDVCRKHEIFLIEDCAHAFYGSYKGKLLGSFGHFSIASPRKFLPVEDGGCLICNAENANKKISLHSRSLLLEVKSVLKCLMGLIVNSVSRFNPSSITHLPPKMEKTHPQSGGEGMSLEEFYVESVGLKGSSVSKFLISIAPHEKIMSGRREHYGQWLSAVSDLPGCDALFSELPANVVPYVFPLVVNENAEEIFYALKKFGVPIWRWEDFAVSSCVYSKEYRLSLFQLPCHQELSKEQLMWMVETLKLVVNKINA